MSLLSGVDCEANRLSNDTKEKKKKRCDESDVVRSSVRSFVHSFVRLFVRLFTCLVCLRNCSFANSHTQKHTHIYIGRTSESINHTFHNLQRLHWRCVCVCVWCGVCELTHALNLSHTHSHSFSHTFLTHSLTHTHTHTYTYSGVAPLTSNIEINCSSL